jgi:hypothetical protein
MDLAQLSLAPDSGMCMLGETWGLGNAKLARMSPPDDLYYTAGAVAPGLPESPTRLLLREDQGVQLSRSPTRD